MVGLGLARLFFSMTTLLTSGVMMIASTVKARNVLFESQQ
jgi:hypothetical protein